jgi:hypothetical protein
MKKILITILTCVAFSLLTFKLVKTINKAIIKPSKSEQELLNNFFGDLMNIKDSSDILKLQNFTVENIIHKQIQDENSEIIVDSILSKRAGFCYDRSLLLQKIFLSKGYVVRPIYLYLNKNNSSITSFFDKNLQSHSIFEILYKDEWYVVQTNTKQTKMKTLEEYLVEKKREGSDFRYIMHLSNRNGKFIYPSWIPDIY